MVMRYENRSFTLPASSGDITNDRWEEIFGTRNDADIIECNGPDEREDVTLEDAVDVLIDEEEDREVKEEESHISHKNPSIAQADGYSGEHEETAKAQSSLDRLLGMYEND